MILLFMDMDPTDLTCLMHFLDTDPEATLWKLVVRTGSGSYGIYWQQTEILRRASELVYHAIRYGWDGTLPVGAHFFFFVF